MFIFAVRRPSHSFVSGQTKYTKLAAATPLLSTNFVCEAPLWGELLFDHLFLTMILCSQVLILTMLCRDINTGVHRFTLTSLCCWHLRNESIFSM